MSHAAPIEPSAVRASEVAHRSFAKLRHRHRNCSVISKPDMQLHIVLG